MITGLASFVVFSATPATPDSEQSKTASSDYEIWSTTWELPGSKSNAICIVLAANFRGHR
jgi:hypothetical protein